MLRTRVVTALLLLFAFLAALYWLPAALWAAAAVAIAAAAAFEWAALLGLAGARRWVYALLVAALVAAILLSDNLAATSIALASFAVSLAFWSLLAPLWLERKWRIASSSGLFIGAVMVVPTALALVLLRAISPSFVLAVMAVIWVADISAYFVGRAFGRHKLAPQISPGKSWEGALGGCAGVLLYGFAVVAIAGYHLNAASAVLLAVLLLATAALSIVGDLFESLAKRQIGVKDSGRILPGHGGLLDRLDSLTATLPGIALCSVTPLLRAKLGI
jgi:phosphatidate cytidylyltransferase